MQHPPPPKSGSASSGGGKARAKQWWGGRGPGVGLCSAGVALLPLFMVPGQCLQQGVLESCGDCDTLHQLGGSCSKEGGEKCVCVCVSSFQLQTLLASSAVPFRGPVSGVSAGEQCPWCKLRMRKWTPQVRKRNFIHCSTWKGAKGFSCQKQSCLSIGSDFYFSHQQQEFFDGLQKY